MFLWFVRGVEISYRNGELELHYRFDAARLTTVESIRPWMTFSYLNFVFHLPGDYLRNALNIDDPHYPGIQISSYAKNAGLNQQQLITEIQDAIKNYWNSNQ